MLGFSAVTTAMINVVGGFMITDRMLKMFRKKEASADGLAKLSLQIAYLASSVLFILGLKVLSSPATARRGMFLAEIGMLMAVVGTLLGHHIITWEWIILGLIIGSVVGAADGHLHADDRDAGTNRDFALLRRDGGGVCRHRRVPLPPGLRTPSRSAGA